MQLPKSELMLHVFQRTQLHIIVGDVSIENEGRVTQNVMCIAATVGTVPVLATTLRRGKAV